MSYAPTVPYHSPPLVASPRCDLQSCRSALGCRQEWTGDRYVYTYTDSAMIVDPPVQHLPFIHYTTPLTPGYLILAR